MNIYDPKFNSWLEFANKELDWFSTDSEFTYNQNLSTNYKLLSEMDYINKSIKYKFNSNGFRCEEFTDKPGIMFLGCSITQGVGIPERETFANIISDCLKLKCYNMGQQGKSSDTAFRIFYHFVDKIKPKLVVSMFVIPDRFEILDKNKSIDFSVNTLHEESYLNEFYKTFSVTEENIFLNNLKNILSIKHMCEQRQIKFIDASSLKNTIRISRRPHLARDLIHPGPRIHENISLEILSLINSYS